MVQGTRSGFVALGRYRILRRLEYGGMSEIYLAYDERLHSEVALKVVDMAQEDRVQRFRREVATLAMLSHQHILPVLDWGEQDGWCYFAMPYLMRGSLRDRLMQGLLTLEEAGSIFEQVASALDYAHQQGVLHRDIKPSNILFRDERHVYLADFGLAKLVGQEEGITQTGCLIGTLEYVAPELAIQRADQRSDIYALGVLLYKMLTGQVPFKATSALALHLKHASERPLRPSKLNPSIVPAVERIILKALEKDPADRFSSAQQMAEAYRQSLRMLKHPQTLRGWGVSFCYRLRLSLVRVQMVVRFWRAKMGKSVYSLLTRICRPTAAAAMIMLLCVAPLYLGFSLSKQAESQAEALIGVQVSSSYLDTQPLLQWNHSQSIPRRSLKSLLVLPDTLHNLSPSIRYHQYLPLRRQSTRLFHLAGTVPHMTRQYVPLRQQSRQGKRAEVRHQQHEQPQAQEGHRSCKGNCGQI